MPAKESDLGFLHEELAKALLAKIRSGEATSSDFNVARQLLKDNGINCDPENNKPIKDIYSHIPEFEGQEIYVKPLEED